MACGCRQQLLRLTCCRARPTGAVTGERKKTVLQGCRIALIGTRTASVSRSPQCSTPLVMDSGLVCVAGTAEGPSIAVIMAVLGRADALRRLRGALDRKHDQEDCRGLR